MKNLYILGAGGFGHVIKDMAEQSGKYTKICFLDDNSNEAVDTSDTDEEKQRQIQASLDEIDAALESAKKYKS